MKNKVVILIIVCLNLAHMTTQAQKTNIWVTYGQSKFIYAPGIEANYFFKNFLGMQLGLSTYFNSPNKQQVANIYEKCSFNFYNTNIGFCTNFIKHNTHQLGGTLGCKLYYGADYKYLSYYSAGDYDIYFDASEYRVDWGIDFGIFYSYKRLSSIIKFDTARNKWRIGFGYRFGETTKIN